MSNKDPALAGKEARQGRHGYYVVRVENDQGALVAPFHGHAVNSGRPLGRPRSDTE